MAKFGAVCKVDGCANSNRDKKSFFRFPKNTELCQKWIKACGRTELEEKFKEVGTWNLNRVYRVCSDHFKLTDFRNPNLFSQGIWKDTVPTVKVFYVEEEDPKKKDKSKSGNLATNEVPPTRLLSSKMKILHEHVEVFKGDHNYTLSNNLTIRNLQCDILDLKKKLEEKKKKLRLSQQGLSRYRARCKYLRSTVEKLKLSENLKKKRKQSKETVGFHSLNILNSDVRIGKLKMGRRYTSTDRKFALALYHCSSKSYELLQKEFCLPTVRSLRKWITVKTEDANEEESNLTEIPPLKHEVLNIEDNDESLKIYQAE